MKTIAIALGSIRRCGLCQVLLVYGVSSPEAIRAFNGLRERNGYRGKPVFGKEWVELLTEHEAMHQKRGEVLPDSMTVRALSEEFLKSLEPAPKPERQGTPLEEEAIKRFLQIAKPVIHQRNGREDNKPVIKKLDATPFAGF